MGFLSYLHSNGCSFYGGGSYFWCLKECTGKNPEEDKDKEFWLEVGSNLSDLKKNIDNINSSLAEKAPTSIATQSINGLLSAADKKKLDGIQAGAQVNPDLSGYATTSAMNTALAGKAGTGVVSQSANGLMSATDKKKLDGIAAGATNTPTVSVSSLFPKQNTNPGHLAVFDSSYVNAGYLPIANAKTLFTPAVVSQSANGLMSADDKKKLDGIAAGAQVNTDTHWTTRFLVGAAGAYANAVTANGATYLKVFDNQTLRDQHLIKGAGSVSVTSDANGHVIITGTDTNTTYSVASQSANGLMSAADKKKLDGIAAGAQVNPNLSGYVTTSAMNTALASKASTSVASQSTDGLLSAADKKKLDGIQAGAQVNTDTHWTTHLYVGASNGSTNAATTNGNTYLMVLDNSTVRDRKLIKGTGATTVTSDKNGNITINSTDTNTTYSVASQSANGLMSAADKKKLDGIAAGAQVNPNLSNYMTLTGDQTITGLNNIQRPDGYFMRLKATGHVLGTKPAKDHYSSIAFTDSNTVFTGGIVYTHTTKNEYSLALTLTHKVNSTSTSLGIHYDETTGVGYGTCPSPADSSNTSHIATTYWVRARIMKATGKSASAFSLNPSDTNSNIEDTDSNFSVPQIPSIIGSDILNSKLPNIKLAIDCIKEEASQRIFFGFEYEFKDTIYFFTYDLYDQQNLADLFNLSLSVDNITVFARDEGMNLINLVMTSNEYKQLYNYSLQNHKLAIASEALEKKNALLKCKDEEEMKKLLDDYGLLDSFNERVKYQENISSDSLN